LNLILEPTNGPYTQLDSLRKAAGGLELVDEGAAQAGDCTDFRQAQDALTRRYRGRRRCLRTALTIITQFAIHTSVSSFRQDFPPTNVSQFRVVQQMRIDINHSTSPAYATLPLDFETSEQPK
jgi:hypothetical protein